MRCVLLATFVGCTELPIVTEADAGILDSSAIDATSQDSSAADSGAATAEKVCDGNASGTVFAGSTPVFCDQGWALVLVATATSSAFSYDGGCWDPVPAVGKCPLGSAVGSSAGDNTIRYDARFPSYTLLPGTKIRVDFVEKDGALRTVVFPYGATPKPLGSAIAQGMTVAEPSSRQGAGNFNLNPTNVSSGINLGAAPGAQVRLGFVGGDGVAPPTSWAGVGGKISCKQADPTTVGNGYLEDGTLTTSCTATNAKLVQAGMLARVYIR